MRPINFRPEVPAQRIFPSFREAGSDPIKMGLGDRLPFFHMLSEPSDFLTKSFNLAPVPTPFSHRCMGQIFSKLLIVNGLYALVFCTSGMVD